MSTNRTDYVLQGFITDENFNKQYCILALKGQKYQATFEEVRNFVAQGNNIQHAIITDTDIKIDCSYKKHNYLGQYVGSWRVDEYYGCNEINKYGFWLCTCLKCNTRHLVAEISFTTQGSMQCNNCRLNAITPKVRTATEDWEPIEYVGPDTTQRSLWALWKYKCKHCGKIAILPAVKVDNIHMVPRCECLRGHSRFEDEVYNYIKTLYNGTIQRNTKNLINPQEIDIYMPELKLAIECNGSYWHSDSVRPSINYHIDKTNKCTSKNVRLIHIFEYEWLTIQNKLKAYLSQQLGVNKENYFARNCKVIRISNQLAYEFCNKYHLQGGINSTEALGLFFNQELLMVASFGPQRFNTPCDAELLRLCSRAYTHVTGGASKLLTAYIKLHPTNTIVSYCNLAKFTGQIYKQLGFNYLGASRPNYVYVDHQTVLTRYQCQKHKLVEQGFDSNLSESQIMTRRGFNKVYDCGNAIYVYEP